MLLDGTEHDPPDPTRAESSGVSRRTLVKTAAGAGVAIAVAGTVGIGHASTGAPRQAAANSLGANSLAGGTALTGGTAANLAGPVVVHVIDAAAGKLEMFTNDTRTEIRDVDLATRISRVAGGRTVVVHVLDANAGTLDTFTSGTRTQIQDRDLANRIVRAA